MAKWILYRDCLELVYNTKTNTYTKICLLAQWCRDNKIRNDAVSNKISSKRFSLKSTFIYRFSFINVDGVEG